MRSLIPATHNARFTSLASATFKATRKATGIANTGMYKFTPVNRFYVGIVTNQTGQNYDTLVFGDTAASFVETCGWSVSTCGR